MNMPPEKISDDTKNQLMATASYIMSANGLDIPQEEISKFLHSFNYDLRETVLALAKDPRASRKGWDKTPRTPAKDDLSTAFKSIRIALHEREKKLKQMNATRIDTSAILKAIDALGGSTKAVIKGKGTSAPKQTASPSPAAEPIKHATSQSITSSLWSITSSFWTDSDVNLSFTHKEEKKKAPKTVVNSGYVQLTSSDLNYDESAVFQQNHQLTMAARGVDASYIASSYHGLRRRKINSNNK